MRLPRRGVLIRLFIYVPLIGFLTWRVVDARCGEAAPTVEPEPSLQDQLAPYRKTIVLPDGTQQEIVELTPEQAEAVLGHPLPVEPEPRQPAPPPAEPLVADGPLVPVVEPGGADGATGDGGVHVLDDGAEGGDATGGHAAEGGAAAGGARPAVPAGADGGAAAPSD